MKPVEFENQNCVYGKGQKGFLPLPAHKDEEGTVTSCWELTDRELKILFETKRIYLRLLTFNRPLQPILLLVKNPIHER